MTHDRYGGEEVLVVPTLLFHELGYFQGFNANAGPYLKVLLEDARTLFLPRAAAEEDPSYKQLIPYCLYRCGGRVFHYRRGAGIGEGRLSGKRSVGVGGHISRADAEHGTGRNLYDAGMRREIEEEIAVGCPVRETLWGLLNDDSTPVGRVHLGVVHLFDLDEPKVQPRETSIAESGFARPEELVADRDGFETWSQLCLDRLAEAPR